ncbi:copine-5-like [Salvelinus alpinus]|uniref:copine-5-like n=1 Tax=Salvelinus alpinus TaxID=8036 RepID=UPI0039FD3E53
MEGDVMDKLEDMASVYEFDPITGNIPATKVEITVSCRNLLDKDTFSKSDPLCVLYTQGVETKQWREFGRTEVIDNTLNPDFVRKYILDYFFEEKQNLRFDLYDVDSKSPDLSKHDFLGQVFCTLGEIVGSPASRLEKPLGGIAGKKCGTIILSVEELGNCRDSATMQFCANKLDKKDFFGKSDPFIVFYRSNEDGTVVVTFTLLPQFRTQINFTVAIDFTASNGNPSQSTSLHYMNPYQMNAYAMALKAVGEIIQDYDSDKMFPALGFGAKLPPDGQVSHEFPLNGNIENPYCNGIDGILEAYHESLKTVQLYGPTNFAPVVNHVARYAAAVQDGSQYFILLIITDGVISDMAQTKEAIVNGAKLPMSIIIVGVGQAEFDAMVELDGDDIRISSRGKLAERDIVQFVPFRDYMDRTGNHVLSMARLAKDVLAEIPDQFISYMKSRGIKPNPAPPPYTTSGHTHHTQI